MFQKQFPDSNNRGRKIFMIMFFGLLFILAIPYILMLLWNSVIPDVTHFSSINYKQALALFILSRILFGGFKFDGRDKNNFRRKGLEWKQKWQSMSNEEREQFKENWKKRCDERKN